MAKAADVAKDASDNWLGREPSGSVSDDWVYWILDDEQITIKDAPATGVTFGDESRIADLPSLCSTAAVDPRHRTEHTPEVAARLLIFGALVERHGDTKCKYKFIRCDNTETAGDKLADEIRVEIPGIPTGTSGELRLLSRELANSGTQKSGDIILRGPSGATIDLYFGNAPEGDLPAVIYRDIPNHRHGDVNVHFELHYRLAVKNPSDIVPVPILVPNSCPSGPPLPGTDGCPPAKG
jgi:hypothetical protein